MWLFDLCSSSSCSSGTFTSWSSSFLIDPRRFCSSPLNPVLPSFCPLKKTKTGSCVLTRRRNRKSFPVGNNLEPRLAEWLAWSNHGSTRGKARQSSHWHQVSSMAAGTHNQAAGGKTASPGQSEGKCIRRTINQEPWNPSTSVLVSFTSGQWLLVWVTTLFIKVKNF